MYMYQNEKSKIFTDDGQRLFLKIRDQVNDMLNVSGAVTMGKAMSLPEGIGACDSWLLMACVDRMVELKEIEEIGTNGVGQNRIFILV